MKIILQLLAAIALATAVRVAAQENVAPPPPPAESPPLSPEASFFYDQLAPHGQWFWLEPYGWVWTPNDVDPAWRPYTDGHWVYTDCGWTWMSECEWGWAPFHYGRWFFHDHRGWFWVPGRDWAPAKNEMEASHEPLSRKRQRAAALQDASEGGVLPGFREVLDCARPLALWLPLQKWVHGLDARPLLVVEPSPKAARRRVRFAAGRFTGASALAILVLGGCAVGPTYHRPAALGAGAMPAAFGDASVTNAADWKTANPAAHLPRGSWWELYGDAELDRLETLAADKNQQIAVAMANFEQARAAVKVARADFFPQLSATQSATRQRTSANTSPNSALAGKSTTFNLFKVSADASWELDLWGLLSNQLAEETSALVSARRTLDISNNRYKAGVEAYLDVITAQTTALTHELTVIQLSAQRRSASVALIKSLGGGWQAEGGAQKIAIGSNAK